MKYLLVLISLLILSCKPSSSSSVTDNVVEATTSTLKDIPEVVAKSATTAQVKSQSRARIIDNAPTPDFPFNVMLKDTKADLVNSNEIFKKNGKPTVLLFWLTTCPPCKMKMRTIKPLYTQWAEESDFNIYAISGDWSKNFDKFVSYTEEQDWPWPTYNDVNRGFREVLPGGLNGYPQSFVFDKDGKLVYQDKRFRHGDEKRLYEQIKKVCQSS